MKMFSACSGECCLCACSGFCAAGHGDDDFWPATDEQILKRLAKGEFPGFRDLMKAELKKRGIFYDENADDVIKKLKEELTLGEFSLVRVSDPIPREKIYYQFNSERNILDPCIVEKGEYLDEKFHRLSNFWYWFNLRTQEKECGYGCFYELLKKGENF